MFRNFWNMRFLKFEIFEIWDFWNLRFLKFEIFEISFLKFEIFKIWDFWNEIFEIWIFLKFEIFKIWYFWNLRFMKWHFWNFRFLKIEIFEIWGFLKIKFLRIVSKLNLPRACFVRIEFWFLQRKSRYKIRYLNLAPKLPLRTYRTKMPTIRVLNKMLTYKIEYQNVGIKNLDLQNLDRQIFWANKIMKIADLQNLGLQNVWPTKL